MVINLTGASGTLASPGYPDTYTNETDYKWIITVLPYNSVTLTFLDFETSCWQGELKVQAMAYSYYSRKRQRGRKSERDLLIEPYE